MHGFGRWLVHQQGEPVGNVKLEYCYVTGEPEVDLGYAIFPDYWRRGYAREAATGALSVAHGLGLKSVIAIALVGNEPFFAVMRSLGLSEERSMHLPSGAHTVWRLRF